jgi:hypothetical protein
MKKLIIALITLGVLIFGLFLAKNAIAKFAISKGVKTTTGLGLGIENIDVGMFKPVVDAKGLIVYNPDNFTDKKMADIPFFYLNYDLGSFLSGGAHLRKLKIHLKEIVIVKNKAGELNLRALEKIAKEKEKKQSKKEKAKKKKEFKIDFLALKIGDVVYKDYSQGEPAKVRKFEVSLDQSYKNITDSQTLTNLILVKALANTAISNFIDFDLKSLKENINQISESVQNRAAEVIKEGEGTVKEATDAIKDILPFGQKE